MYTKFVSNGYIVCVGTGGMGTKITEAEYTNILSVIRNKPAGTDTTDYRLKEDLTWEAFEMDPPDPEDDEITTEEAMAIILGGAT